MHRTLDGGAQSLRVEQKGGGGVGGEIYAEAFGTERAVFHARSYTAHLSMVVNAHLPWRQELRHAELMLGLCLYLQGSIMHGKRQMQCARHLVVGKRGVELQPRDVEIAIYGIRQVGIDPASHGG